MEIKIDNLKRALKDKEEIIVILKDNLRSRELTYCILDPDGYKKREYKLYYIPVFYLFSIVIFSIQNQPTLRRIRLQVFLWFAASYFGWRLLTKVVSIVYRH